MRLVYYTHPHFLDPALHVVRALAAHAEVHLLLELAPGGWRSALFDLPPRPLPPGLIAADPILAEAFPPTVRACWQDAASFHLVVHDVPRSLHPAAWRVSRQAAHFMRDVGADLVHVDDVDVTPRLPLAFGSLPRVPLALNVHDPTPHSGEHNWRKVLSRALAYRRASRFVLHNAAQADDFTRRYPATRGRVSVVHLAPYRVYRAWAGEPVAEDPRMVLFFGRLSPYKGLEVLYAAAERLAREVPGLRLVVAGRAGAGYTPPPPPTLANGGTVETIASYIPNDRLADLFQRAAVVVCPYTDATQSGVVLTAYAFERPVVATRVGGLPEYVPHDQAGLLVPPGDAAALAEALAAVLTRDDLRARLRQGVRDLAADSLSWERFGIEMLGVYRALLPSRSVSGARPPQAATRQP